MRLVIAFLGTFLGAVLVLDVVAFAGLLLDVPVRVFLAGARFVIGFFAAAGVFAMGFLATGAFFVFVAGFAAGFAEGLATAAGLVVFLAGAVAAFLEGAGRLVVAVVAPVFFARALFAATGFFDGAGFLVAATGFLAGLGLEAATVAGAVFSFSLSERPLASLTFPEGPLGRENRPFSAPWAIARLMFVTVLADMLKPYFVSTYFLIVGRLTPARDTSG